jgi:hypothetical protein
VVGEVERVVLVVVLVGILALVAVRIVQAMHRRDEA